MADNKKTLSLRMCEVVSDTAHLTEQQIQNVLGTQSCIDKYAYILHDKDVTDNGTPKNPHYHVYLHFTDSRSVEYIAKWFNLSPAFVSKIRGRFGDAIEYATHRNAPDKYQYDFADVKANFDYAKTVQQNIARKDNKISLVQILDDIDNGTIKEYNITDKVDVQDYVKYERQIKRAFEYRAKRLLREVDRDMRVMYIYGGSGTGKTTYAKMIAEQQGYSTFISSGSNDPFDGYKGQECVILDDLRGSVFPLSDLLKILDNNTASTVKSRYKNVMLECKLLIITTTKTMRDFYKQVFESKDEEYKQFQRRCFSVIRMEKKTMSIFSYDELKECYELEYDNYPNPVYQRFLNRQIDKAKRKQELAKLCGITVNNIVNALTSPIDNNSADYAGEFVDTSDYEEILPLDDTD